MSRLIAVEWDAKEARVAIGRTRGSGGVAVEQAFAVPLPQREEGSTAEIDVGGVLGKALAEHGIARADAMVAVGRANIELRFLSTPPVPEEELPDIVRFQAVRQFTTLGEDWPLDYVPLAPNADGGMNVLAAAIAPDLLEQIRKDCTAANITLNKLVLRPFAAAALLKSAAGEGKCRMMVDLLRDEADLTVLIGAQVIFPRTVRLPAVNEPEVLARTLLAEGRRTMIAAQNQLGGRRVEEVVIFGDGLHHTTLKQMLEKELQIEVRLIDPFEQVEWADAKAKKPEFPGTFAPLLGIMLDEAAGAAPVVDFLHPRKRPPPPDQRRRYLSIAGAIAAVVLLGLGVMQWRLWVLDSELYTLRQNRAKQEKLAKASDKPIKDAGQLEAFLAGDVTWLDELATLSAKLPPPEEAVVSVVSAQVTPKGGGGFMKFSGHSDTSKRIAQIEESLRDKQHTAVGKGMGQDTEREALQWAFDETVTIASPLDKPAPATAATKAGTVKSGTAAAKGTETKDNATKTAEAAPASKGGAK
jgi:Tfp pilus assembly PilM family ATPase